jgi:hypothetical protein
VKKRNTASKTARREPKQLAAADLAQVKGGGFAVSIPGCDDGT